MDESIEEQQYQQKLKDVALVPVYKHIQIPSSNLKIALERIQPKVIFKVCLEVLKTHSFFNAFILFADVPVIYMQQFWTKRVAEEIYQNDEVANEADSEETDEEEVKPLIRHRTIGISICRNTSQESKVVEEGPGEGSGIALEVFDEFHLKGSNKEAKVTLKVPDGPGDDSNSSSSKITLEVISSDDDEVLVNDADMSMQA
nr:hypothetical protein [Tanacetum cinerariifolium]